MTCNEVRDLAAAFVLGALEADEADAVREHLAACSDPHLEFAELGSVVPALLETIDQVEPPAALRGRIMAAAARDLAERDAPAPAAEWIAQATTPIAPVAERPALVVERTATAAERPPVPTAERPPVPSVPVIDLAAARQSRRPARLAWVLGIAAVVAIAALGAWNLSLNSDLKAATAYRQQVDAVLAVVAQAGSSSAILTSKDDPQRSGLAAVAADGSVHLVVRGLGANTGTTVYEAWVINATGPIAIGGFTVGADGVGYLTTPAGPGAAGVTVALTLEPGPGATKPAGPVVSSGVAGS